MKRIPSPSSLPESGPKYWRSLDELANTPEFNEWAAREFPAGASELVDPVNRRTFVKLMSASFMLAGLGLSGCRRPLEQIYPFSKMPEGYVHGMPKYYATGMPTRRSAIPLLAKSNDGRPTKLEGNPNFSESKGVTDRYAQAAILDLYDPDRAMRYAKNGNNITAAAAHDELAQLAQSAQANGGGKLCFLAQQSSSPSRERLQQAILQKLPQTKWYEYEPVDFDIHRQAASLAFGQPVAPIYKLENAKVIVSLDCDFIGSEEDAFVNIRKFTAGRKLKDKASSMSRLYVVEALMTLTGVNADHRLRLPSGAVLQMAALIAGEVLRQSDQADSALASRIAGMADASTVKALNDQLQPRDGSNRKWSADWIQRWATECAKDLLANKGNGLVLAGYRQPLAVHLIAHAMNAALGNVGSTVVLREAPEPKAGTISELADALNAGQVETLVILGGNPVYNAPVDLNWAEAQAKAANVIRLGYMEDESFPTKGLSLPMAHFLESWGDARSSDGTIVSVQPLIDPLFGGMTEIEVLAQIAGSAKTNPYDIVRETFQVVRGGSEEDWKNFVHDGLLPNTAYKIQDVRLDAGAVAQGLASVPTVTVPEKGKLEVIFHRDYSVDDGRFNNNGWLQEMPDPVTKMTWENTILLSVQTAKDLGLNIRNDENNRLRVPWVKITLDGRVIEGPAWIQPGQADNVLGLALGYGRAQTGRVGKNSGFNAYKLRSTKGLHIAAGGSLADTGDRHLISTTQDHWSMEGRAIVREATLKHYQEEPDFADKLGTEKPETFSSLYPNPLEKNLSSFYQWGMVVDMNSCVGCSTCMMACQSENNIPIVGKQQVANNREMHWIRLDRYYTGHVEDPQVVTQPMMCQHCEAAPCENVCPVNATAHNTEGLNVMAYNRCVGTRYCSNNCPYKVRRFNFFDYNRRSLEQLKGPVYNTPLTHSTDGEWDLLRWWRNPDRGTQPTDQWELLKLVKNPDVTVRMRGVMEKCSMCVQRIEQAKISQKVKAGASGDVEVPVDSIKTACQQACPAEAITFGNLLDENSAVNQLKKSDRNYSVLEFLNTKPRVTYLAKVRNPNPAMPDSYEAPWSTVEFYEHNKPGTEGAAEEAEQGVKKGAE